MTYDNTTPRFLIPFPDAGQVSSAAEEERRELALENPLEAALYILTAGLWDGTIYDGFLVSAGAGLSISVAAGYGFVDGLAIYAAAPTTKSSLTDNSTLYIYLKKTSTTPADRSFTVEQSLSGPPLADAIYIATITTSGGTVTTVNNSPASRSPRVRVPGLPRVRVVAPYGAEYTSPKTAIEACNEGDVVYICAGTYTLTATITLPNNNISVVGANSDACILSNTSGSTQNVVNLNGKSGIKFRNLTIQAAAGNAGYGITGAGCDDPVLEHVKILSVALDRGISLWATACNRARILNCRFTGAYGTYVLLCNAPSGKILGNRFEPTSNPIILDSRGDDALVADNEVVASYSGFSSMGIVIRSCLRIRCCNNLVRATTSPGAWIGVAIHGESLNAGWVHVADNVIISSGDAGIGIRLYTAADKYCDEAIIASNICGDFATGIHLVDARVRETLVHGNKVATCTAGVTDAGTNTNTADQD